MYGVDELEVTVARKGFIAGLLGSITILLGIRIASLECANIESRLCRDCRRKAFRPESFGSSLLSHEMGPSEVWKKLCSPKY
jgi:hypothetical protein